jgi:hypothetical protein
MATISTKDFFSGGNVTVVESAGNVRLSSTPQQSGQNRVLQFAKNVGKDIVRPFARAGVTAYDIATAIPNLASSAYGAVTGDKQREQAQAQVGMSKLGSKNIPFLGEVKPLTGVNLDTAGAAASAASTIVGGGGVAKVGTSTLAGLAKQAVVTGAKSGAISGASAGFGSAAQDPSSTVGDITTSTLTGGVVGGGVGAATGLLTPISMGVFKLASKGVQKLSGGAQKIAKDTVDTFNPDAVAALTKAVKPGANNSQWASSVKLSLPVLADTEKAIGKPINSLESLNDALLTSKQRSWATFQKLLGPNANATIRGDSIADEMVKGIDRRFAAQNPGAVERIQAIADTYRRPLSLQEAEDFLQSANNDLFSYYAKNKVGQKVAEGDPNVAYVLREANALRTALYGKLDELTGSDAASFKRVYGALSNMQQEVQKRVNIARRQNPASLQETLNLAQGFGKILKSAANTEFGDALSGAGQIIASKVLKNTNSPDSLIEKAITKAKKLPK